MKKLMLLGIFVLVPSSVFSSVTDSASIGGIVLNEGNPVKGVFISISGDAGFIRDTVSLENGSYLFEDVPEGSYVLKMETKKGYVSSQIVFVSSGQRLDLGAKELLGEGSSKVNKTLSPFLISSSLDYVRDASSLAFGKSSQYPGTINTVTREFISDIPADTAIDVLIQSTPGVVPQSGYDSDFIIRGFRSAAVSINGLKMPRNRIFTGFPYNFVSESIEVIKGSSGFQGVPTPGGMVNYVLKRPHFDRFRGAVDVSASTMNSKYKVHVDLSGPMYKQVVDGKSVPIVAGRLNVALMYGATPNPNIDKSVFAAVSSIDVRKGIFSLKTDALAMFNLGVLDRGVAVDNDKWVNNARDVSLQRLNKDDDFQKNLMGGLNMLAAVAVPEIITGELHHKINVSLGYRMQISSEACREYRIDNKYFTDEKGVIDKTKVLAKHGYKVFENDSHQFNLETMYGIKQKNIQSKFRLGTDIGFFRMPKMVDFEQKYYLSPEETGTTKDDINERLKNIKNWKAKLLHHDLLGKNDGFVGVGFLVPPVKKGLDNTLSLGFYFLNQTELYDWATVLAGIRYDYVIDFKGATRKKNETQQGVSPVFGLVGHLLKRQYGFDGLDLYAGVATGFEPVSTKDWYLGAESGKSFQVDGGVRAKVKNGYYLSLGGYYLREINHRKRNRDFDKTKPIDEKNRPSIVFPIVDCLGTEFEAKGEVIRGLYMGGVYSWCYKLGETRPENKATQKNGIYVNSMPEHSGSVWVKYVLPITPLRGLGARISFTGFGPSKRPKLSDSPGVGDFPSQYWANATISYSRKMFSGKLSFENIGGGRVWKASYSAFRSFPRYDGFVISAGIGLKF